MNLSMTAGGTPDQITTSLRSQVDSQLGTTPSSHQAAVADAVQGYVAKELEGHDGTASISVSLSIYVWKSAPAVDAVPGLIAG